MDEKRFYIKRLRDVKLPTKAYENAAGFDFYIPNSFKKVEEAEEHVEELTDWDYQTIYSHTSLFIPSGLMIKMHPDWFLKFENKSGMAKKGLMVGCSIVDPDYQGEIHINLWNISGRSITFKPGDKIVQGIFYHKPNIQLNEIQACERLFASASVRGTSGFGSSDSKY